MDFFFLTLVVSAEAAAVAVGSETTERGTFVNLDDTLVLADKGVTKAKAVCGIANVPKRDKRARYIIMVTLLLAMLLGK